MIEWVKDRIEGYLISKGLRKATEVALVTLAGWITAAMAKPVTSAAIEQLKMFGVAAVWDGKIFSLQINMDMLVTAGVAFVGALLVNFLFRKKTEPAITMASESKTISGG